MWSRAAVVAVIRELCGLEKTWAQEHIAICHPRRLCVRERRAYYVLLHGGMIGSLAAPLQWSCLDSTAPSSANDLARTNSRVRRRVLRCTTSSSSASQPRRPASAASPDFLPCWAALRRRYAAASAQPLSAFAGAISTGPSAPETCPPAD